MPKMKKSERKLFHQATLASGQLLFLVFLIIDPLLFFSYTLSILRQYMNFQQSIKQVLLRANHLPPSTSLQRFFLYVQYIYPSTQSPSIQEIVQNLNGEKVPNCQKVCKSSHGPNTIHKVRYLLDIHVSRQYTLITYPIPITL